VCLNICIATILLGIFGVSCPAQFRNFGGRCGVSRFAQTPWGFYVTPQLIHNDYSKRDLQHFGEFLAILVIAIGFADYRVYGA
jgi:hypothetical protein